MTTHDDHRLGCDSRVTVAEVDALVAWREARFARWHRMKAGEPGAQESSEKTDPAIVDALFALRDAMSVSHLALHDDCPLLPGIGERQPEIARRAGRA